VSGLSKELRYRLQNTTNAAAITATPTSPSTNQFPVISRGPEYLVIAELSEKGLGASRLASVGRGGPAFEQHRVNRRIDMMRRVAAERMMVVHQRDRAAAVRFVKTDGASAREEPASYSPQDPHCIRLDRGLPKSFKACRLLSYVTSDGRTLLHFPLCLLSQAPGDK
jgi:hypothetical protein